MLPIATIPVFLGVFGAIQGMSKVPVAGMMTEGLGWFTNLAAPDPYLGLQLMTATFYAASFKFGGETGSNTLSPAMRKLFMYMPFIAVPMTMSLPAGTCYYFAISGVLSVAQTTLMRNASFRRFMKLEPIVKPPPTAEDNMSIFASLRSSLDKAKQRAEAQSRRDDKSKQEWDLYRAAQDREFARIKPKNDRK
jgi:YidC/Oxa1 family membrane protein insertase